MTKTSVLVLEKKEPKELGDYDIFMAVVDKVGWDSRKNLVYEIAEGGIRYAEVERRVIRIVNGKIIRDKVKLTEPVIADETEDVTKLFKEEWRRMA